jgi:myosin heavy subunit
MIRGAAKADRELWKLPAADNVSFFKYLDGPNAVTEIEGVDDSKDFQEVSPAYSAVICCMHCCRR